MYISRDDKMENAANLDHQALYERLMYGVEEKGNAAYLAQMLSSWMCGRSALPRYMGLAEDDFSAVLECFPPEFRQVGLTTRRDVEPERASELADVKSLLLEHHNGASREEFWIAQIVATGCMGSDHLWSDLGLFSRKSLGQMLLANFRTLAEQNVNNMRWKKFFYRQLCAKEGFILCRSPSCETCSEYKVCFAPENE
nr:nitrogen fixation protein NifQ [uncultured Cohaesibacter sp.]